MYKWQNDATVSVTLQTGCAGMTVTHNDNTTKDCFVKAVGKESKQRGFGLFVKELSRLGLMARSIIGLTLAIHHESILNEMLMEALGEDDRMR
eukprot:scaffold87626_cov29-Attheya_sp.AAC.1